MRYGRTAPADALLELKVRAERSGKRDALPHSFVRLTR